MTKVENKKPRFKSGEQLRVNELGKKNSCMDKSICDGVIMTVEFSEYTHNRWFYHLIISQDSSIGIREKYLEKVGESKDENPTLTNHLDGVVRKIVDGYTHDTIFYILTKIVEGVDDSEFLERIHFHFKAKYEQDNEGVV